MNRRIPYAVRAANGKHAVSPERSGRGDGRMISGTAPLSPGGCCPRWQCLRPPDAGVLVKSIAGQGEPTHTRLAGRVPTGPQLRGTARSPLRVSSAVPACPEDPQDDPRRPGRATPSPGAGEAGLARRDSTTRGAPPLLRRHRSTARRRPRAARRGTARMAAPRFAGPGADLPGRNRRAGGRTHDHFLASWPAGGCLGRASREGAQTHGHGSELLPGPRTIIGSGWTQPRR